MLVDGQILFRIGPAVFAVEVKRLEVKERAGGRPVRQGGAVAGPNQGSFS